MASQLAGTLDRGCEPLGEQGARGALFRLTLESHGYTFVAKGTVEAFKDRLQDKARIYRHLRRVQGHLVPVYLGSTLLTKPYHLLLGFGLCTCFLCPGLVRKLNRISQFRGSSSRTTSARSLP